MSPSETNPPSEVGPRPPSDGARRPDLASFLASSEPRAAAILHHFRIPAAATPALLEQALLALVYRWHELGDPSAWLEATLTSHCRRYWRRRDAAEGPRPGTPQGTAALEFDALSPP